MRSRLLNKKPASGSVMYWMSREQRVEDNFSLLEAQKLAKDKLIVVFCISPSFLESNFRHYDFMLKGLMEVEKNLNSLNIPFYLLNGDPKKEIARFTKENKINTVVTDFDPLKIKERWKKGIKTSLIEVDSHNIIPCWLTSQKQEYSARTIRTKIQKLLPYFLSPIPKPKKQKKTAIIENKWNKLKLNIDRSVAETSFIPGEKAALSTLRLFIKNLNRYHLYRNDPNKNATSNLSPYIHFGQISAQRIALEVSKSNASGTAKTAFMEEVIVRKELAENFCYYNRHYDSVKCFPDWAKKTLEKHLRDKREYTYNLDEFEKAKTHDDLWNAAQLEMKNKGKMHSYMRMYWAKKILEWTNSPEEAMKSAILLNDKYEIDGRDSNGYAGIAWSIGGIHDRPWPERKIFGKIRYMSYDGCKSKFNIKEYIGSNSIS